MRERADIADELLRQWTIEPVLGAQRFAHLLADIWIIEYRAEGIARREMNQRESDGGDNRHDHGGLAEPTRDVADHPLGSFLTRPAGLRGRSRRLRHGGVVARDTLVTRNRPLRDVRPPRIRSQCRELESRMIADYLPRFRQPDCRRVLDDRLVGSREVAFASGRIKRVESAIDVRIEYRALIRPVVIAARRARSSGTPGSSHRAGT